MYIYQIIQVDEYEKQILKQNNLKPMKIQQKYDKPDVAKLERIKEEKESNLSQNTLNNRMYTSP